MRITLLTFVVVGRFGGWWWGGSFGVECWQNKNGRLMADGCIEFQNKPYPSVSSFAHACGVQSTVSGWRCCYVHQKTLQVQRLPHTTCPPVRTQSPSPPVRSQTYTYKHDCMSSPVISCAHVGMSVRPVSMEVLHSHSGGALDPKVVNFLASVAVFLALSTTRIATFLPPR